MSGRQQVVIEFITFRVRDDQIPTMTGALSRLGLSEPQWQRHTGRRDPHDSVVLTLGSNAVPTAEAVAEAIGWPADSIQLGK